MGIKSYTALLILSILGMIVTAPPAKNFDFLRRWYNKIRINWRIMRGQAKRIKLDMPDGTKRDAVIDQESVKVCDHKTITEIAPTFWACTKCPDIYFMIQYKVAVPHVELIRYLDKIASHLGATMRDRLTADQMREELARIDKEKKDEPSR